MTDRYLYVCAVPSDAQLDIGSQTRNQLAAHGLLGSDTGAVDAISSTPSDEAIQLRYFGPYAELMAKEVDELANSTVFSPIPLYTASGTSPADGYYSASSIDAGREEPQTDTFASVSVDLTKEGTRETHRRRVATNPKQVENDFGNAQQCLVGIPAAASDVWWYNSETESTADPSVVATRTGEHGDVAVYDALAAPYDKPRLVYDLPYSRQGKVDVVVWDDHDREKLDSDGVNSWQWVFSTAHEFDGAARVDNGLLRVQLDDALVVEEWDDTGGAWSSVALGASSWELDAWDLTRISPERVDAQVRFRDPGQSPTQYYSLDMRVQRGWPRVLWTVPESLRASNTPETPSGLQDLLAPVASDSDYRPQSEQGLVDRKEVRS